MPGDLLRSIIDKTENQFMKLINQSNFKNIQC